jgi:hypothetical protein
METIAECIKAMYSNVRTRIKKNRRKDDVKKGKKKSRK